MPVSLKITDATPTLAGEETYRPCQVARAASTFPTGPGAH